MDFETKIVKCITKDYNAIRFGVEFFGEGVNAGFLGGFYLKIFGVSSWLSKCAKWLPTARACGL